MQLDLGVIKNEGLSFDRRRIRNNKNNVKNKWQYLQAFTFTHVGGVAENSTKRDIFPPRLYGIRRQQPASQSAIVTFNEKEAIRRKEPHVLGIMRRWKNNNSIQRTSTAAGNALNRYGKCRGKRFPVSRGSSRNKKCFLVVLRACEKGLLCDARGRQDYASLAVCAVRKLCFISEDEWMCFLGLRQQSELLLVWFNGRRWQKRNNVASHL